VTEGCAVLFLRWPFCCHSQMAVRRVPVAYSWLGLRLRGDRARLAGERVTGLSG